MIRRQKNAGTLLANLPASVKSDPAYFFSRVQHLRRAEKWVSAGKVMVQAPRDPARLVDLREWWVERRMVSRKVLEAGHPRLAYQIVSQFSTDRAVDRIDAQFHAGWYALRFAKDPKTALRHFAKIKEISDKPLSRSRALYWMGRAHQALGGNGQARQSYQQAARFPHTYYGQLALRQLGHNSIALPQLPQTAGAKAGFERQLFVQVIRRLDEAGQKGRTGIFYRHLAQTMKNPAHVTLLAVLADQNRLFPISLQVGKLALSNGVNVPRLAFPLGAIPRKAGISNQDKAMAYAIARQESAFNVGAVSHADARGLMQLLPSTAKLTARRIGVSYTPSKLTRDGAYNAKLGSAFLNQ
ncbi:MAG: lytic transglycosylase domain-containing protein, partial [Marinomonas sp.]